NLMPVAMNYLAGGEGAKNFGDAKNILLGVITLIVILIVQRFTTGFLKSIAILIGLIVGTVLASIFGIVDVKQAGEAHWFSLPQPF
ncbi:solute carrier family 23 protein, partial [Staphylococcus aureus]|nr:solute carrier family 23 protein [Staphylococcus aureus]